MQIVRKTRNGKHVLMSCQEWGEEMFGKSEQIQDNRGFQSGVVLEFTIAAAESMAVKRAISVAGGNITNAAKLLNITRATIYEKMKKFGIEIKKNVTLSQRNNSDLQQAGICP